MSIISLIVFFGALLILGIIGVVVEKKKIITQKNYVSDFVNKADELNRTISENADPTESITYILEHYQEVSNVMGEGAYKMPVYKLGSSLSYQNPVDPRLFTQIVAEEIEFNGAKDREIGKLKNQLFNPFVLLYRGVELVMDVIFGYIIRKFYPKFTPDNSTVWKVINAFITIVGSFASILSYLQTK